MGLHGAAPGFRRNGSAAQAGVSQRFYLRAACSLAATTAGFERIETAGIGSNVRKAIGAHGSHEMITPIPPTINLRRGKLSPPQVNDMRQRFQMHEVTIEELVVESGLTYNTIRAALRGQGAYGKYPYVALESK